MKLPKAIKSTMIYFVGNVLSKVIVFFLLPIYTKYIDAADMGTYETSVTVINLVSGFLFLDIGSTILKYRLEKNSSNEEYVITNGTVIFMCSAVVYLIFIGISGIFIDAEYFGWIILYGLLYSFHNVVGYCARSLNYNSDYAVSGVLQTILLTATNLVLILYFKVDYSSLFISFCLSSFISSLYLIVRSKLYRNIRLKLFNMDLFKDMLKFSLPLCVNSIAFWFLNSSNRVILTYMLGAESTGYLSIANKFTQVLYLVSSCIQLTWQETAFSHDNKSSDTGKYYSKAFITYYKSVLYSICLFIAVIKIGLWIFPSFIDSSYNESLNLIPTALLGTALAVISLFLGTILSSIKKPGAIFVTTLAGAVVSVVSNIIMIKFNVGVISANYSFILGYLVTVAMRILTLKRQFAFKCNFANLLILVPAIAAGIYVYINLDIIYNAVALICFLILALVLFRPELKTIVGGLKNDGSKK